MLTDWARFRRVRQPPITLMSRVGVEPAALDGLAGPRRPITARELERAEQTHRAALAAADRTRRTRDALIRQAAREHWPLKDIADATGLPPGRLTRIVGS